MKLGKYQSSPITSAIPISKQFLHQLHSTTSQTCLTISTLGDPPICSAKTFSTAPGHVISEIMLNDVPNLCLTISTYW